MPSRPPPDGFQSSPQITPHEFDLIRTLARRKFGLDLRAGKEGLVSARLGRRLRGGGFSSFRQYYEHVVADSSGEELLALIDALTTNHTSFLREPLHFRFFIEELLPTLRLRSSIDVWCAACATGEEPYTLAFAILDALGAAQRPHVRILATDISNSALETARRAVYSSDRLDGVPQRWKHVYLSMGNGDPTGFYRVRPEVRALIEFRRLNLIEPFRHATRFPAIFCRNVMIYFNAETKQELVNRLAESLEPGGYLFVGHAESLNSLRQPLAYFKPAVYRKDSGLVAAGSRRREAP